MKDIIIKIQWNQEQFYQSVSKDEETGEYLVGMVNVKDKFTGPITILGEYSIPSVDKWIPFSMAFFTDEYLLKFLDGYIESGFIHITPNEKEYRFFDGEMRMDDPIAVFPVSELHNTRIVFDDNEKEVTLNVTEKDHVFNDIIEFSKENGFFTGEQLAQNDKGHIDGIEFLCDIIDRLYNVNYKEE